MTTEEIYFDWPDYLVMALVLVLSTCIGIFYGFYRRSNTTVAEYLFGSRKMQTFPTAMSLLATFTSGTTMIAYPTEVYRYGTYQWLSVLIYPLQTLIIYKVYLPVLYKLKNVSLYQYLENRFHVMVRTVGTIMFMFYMMTFLPLPLLACSLTLSQVTGFGVNIVAAVMNAICIFYTMEGGYKAVVWTDTLQVIVILASLLVIVVKGTYDVGGMETVFTKSYNSGRLSYSLDPSVVLRDTIWAHIFGLFFFRLHGDGLTQTQFQRYLSLPSKKVVRRAMLFYVVSFILLTTLITYFGLLIYAKYSNCDPLLSNRIASPDRLVPLFVLETIGYIQGLPGLFVAGVVSASLSTLSTGMNGLATVAVEDLMKRLCGLKLSEKNSVRLLKGLVVVFGLITYGLMFLFTKVDGILPIGHTMATSVAGPMVGMFTLGMLFPCTNFKGALFGVSTAIALLAWIGVGRQIARASGQLKFPSLPLSMDNCGNVTVSTNQPTPSHGEQAFILYQISHNWYSLIGFLMTVVFGVLMSLLTKNEDKDIVDPTLLSPVTWKVISWTRDNPYLVKRKNSIKKADKKEETRGKFQTFTEAEAYNGAMNAKSSEQN